MTIEDQPGDEKQNNKEQIPSHDEIFEAYIKSIIDSSNLDDRHLDEQQNKERDENDKLPAVKEQLKESPQTGWISHDAFDSFLNFVKLICRIGSFHGSPLSIV